MVVAAMAIMNMAGDAQAGPECEALLASFGISPEDVLEDDAPQDVPIALQGVEISDCSPAQLAATFVNRRALRDATVPSSIDEIAGTWINDRIGPMLAGTRLAVFDLVTISAAEISGDLQIVQEAATHLVFRQPEHPNFTSQSALAPVSKGILFPDGEGGWKNFDERLWEHSSQSLSMSRAWDLMMKADVNHFESVVRFRRLEDTLVIESTYRNPTDLQEMTHVSTFSRISRESAESALWLVVGTESSMARNFLCLARQLEAGSGPFFDLIGDTKTVDIRAVLAEIYEGYKDMTTTRQQLHDAPEGDDRNSLNDRLSKILNDQRKLYDDPAMKALNAATFDAPARFGCSDLP